VLGVGFGGGAHFQKAGGRLGRRGYAPQLKGKISYFLICKKKGRRTRISNVEGGAWGAVGKGLRMATIHSANAMIKSRKGDFKGGEK